MICHQWFDWNNDVIRTRFQCNMHICCLDFNEICGKICDKDPMGVPTSHSSKAYHNFWISIVISNQYCLILINKLRVWPRGLVVHVFLLENWYKSPCIVKMAEGGCLWTSLNFPKNCGDQIKSKNNYFIIKRVITKGNTAVRSGPYLLFSQFKMGFVLSQYRKPNNTQHVSK